MGPFRPSFFLGAEVIKEIINVKGEVKVSLIYEDGRVEVHDHQNLVMRVGKTLLAKLLAHDPAYVNEYISKIGFGTGSAATADTQTALQAQVLTETVTVSYPAYNSVMFTAVMGVSDGGTSSYQEFGLLSNASSILFSRVVTSPLTKSSLFRIQVEWTISFQ